MATAETIIDKVRRLAAQYRLLFAAGQVIELRALKVNRGFGNPCTFAGYFEAEHLDSLARAALGITEKAKGVYFTLNPLNADLLARRHDHLDMAAEGELSKDKDVLRRHWLLIDADPVRDPLVSATKEEKAAAWEVIQKVKEFLAARQWPGPLLNDSGNGYHLLYKIGLPAEDDGIVERLLKALAHRFDTERVKIDQKVFNPSRICKLPGTKAKKGDSVPTRPHREAKIMEVPNDATEFSQIPLVPAELLKALAAEAPRPEPAPSPRPSAGPAHGTNGQCTGQYSSRLDVAVWLNDRGIAHRVENQPDGKGRTVYVLAQCPFDSSHGDPDSCIMQDAAGKLSGQCFHNSCQGRGWQEFKERIGAPEAHHYDPPLTGRSRGNRKRRAGRRVQAGAASAMPNPQSGAALDGAPSGAAPDGSAPPEGDNAADRPQPTESINDPHRLGRAYLRQCATLENRGDRFAYYRGSHWRWDVEKWAVVPDADLNATLTRFAKAQLDADYQRMLEGEGEIAGEPPETVPTVTPRLVSSITNAIEGDCLIPQSSPQPCWRGDGGADPQDWIALANGILDIGALFARNVDVLRPHSPLWFSPTCLPYSFAPDAGCPKWMAFLERNLGDDWPEDRERDTTKARLLRQFAGYLLLHDTSRQRFLLMTGDGSNGKSVVCAMLMALIGEDNCSTVALEYFGDKFKLHNTLGKLANIVAEVGELDKMAEGLLKAFVVGDPMEFEQKFKQAIKARPTARLVLATNNAPMFSDKTDGIWRRVLLLHFTVQIPDEEKIPGMDKPEWWRDAGELPGIFNWALAGLVDLRQQPGGQFLVPESCRTGLQKLRIESNTAKRFLQDHYCEGTVDDRMTTAEVYHSYDEWCRQNGHHAVSDVGLGREMARTFKRVERRRERSQTGGRAYHYVGLACRQD